MPATAKDIRTVARERYGYDELRPGQEEAVRALLDGRDALVVMPTGSGKSAIYQIAALLIDGATFVVSPLIALQRDQAEAIEDAGAPAAAQLNSTLSQTAREETFEALDDRELEFVFLAPEQLANDETLERLRSARPSLLVVDEAHCISEWGHDFRPDYLRLGAMIAELGHPRVLAMTATAAPPVRAEIVERLGLRGHALIVRGFDRPNIHLSAETFHDDGAKTEALLERVAGAAKPGIVYAATRVRAEEIAGALVERGVGAAAYHAGLGARVRSSVQSSFMEDELEVVVATVAFGMGIDKENVRFVFHAEISDSVDSYYQEIGRGGRDGERADAVLFYRPQDVGLRRFFGGATRLSVDEVEEVVDALADRDEPVDPEELRAETGLSGSKVGAAIGRLEDAGAVEVLPTGEVEVGDGEIDPEDAAEAQDDRRELDRSRVDMIRAYAELRDCRREFLLNYFGEPRDEPCGFCDNCEAGIVVADVEQPFAVGSRVRHAEWDEGEVQRYEGDKMVVLFDTVGYKTLAVELVADQALLEPV